MEQTVITATTLRAKPRAVGVSPHEQAGQDSQLDSGAAHFYGETLERVLQNPRIPSPPVLALQVFQKTGQEQCNVAEISDLLALDPGLCAKLLKTLNSAMYGRSRPVTNVRQAVTVIGNRPLRSLVMGLALPAMQSGVQADAGLRAFWKSSVAGAVMAREIAKMRKFAVPDDEMVTCLLRDLGMILLWHAFRDAYQSVWSGERAFNPEEQCEWETRSFSVNHAQVTATLLERWQLPAEVVEPIRYHHHPNNLPKIFEVYRPRTQLLDFVTRLAELELRSKSVAGMEEILRIAREHFGMERSDLEGFLGMVRPKIAEFSSILGVDIGECPNFDELLTAGCEELVKDSMRAAADAGRQMDRSMDLQATVDPSCAFTDHRIRDLVDAPDSVPPGSRILHYEVQGVIGRGAMGIVFKAFDPGLSRHVAIKLMAPEMAGNDKARKRFALEARFAAGVRHENCVAVYGVHEVDGVPCLVMEYVQGSSLGDLLESGRKLKVAEIARVGRQIALGLGAAHEARLIHRDIKPANILVEQDTMHVRVADFGLARAIDSDFQLSQPGLLVGTPVYMSPEQVEGDTLTGASDLFSLGSVLYTMCTLQLPFQADTLTGLLMAVVERDPVPIRSLNPSIPDGLAKIVETLHKKNIADRFPSAAVVADKLKPWCHSSA